MCSPGAPGGVGREKSREGHWSFGEPRGRGRGRRASNRSGRRAGGNRGNLCGRRAGPLLGTEAQPGPHSPAPRRERGSLSVCWAAAEGGGENTGPSPVSSPLEGPRVRSCTLIFLPAVPAGGGQWWCWLRSLPGGRWGEEPRSPSGVLDSALVLPLFGECGWLCKLLWCLATCWCSTSGGKNYLETGVWGKGGGSVLALD